MVNRICDPINGIRYQSILTNIEHISDKCSDLAVYIMERENTAIFGQEHSFVHELHHSSTDEYIQDYDNDRSKYFDVLKEIPPVKEVIEKAPDTENVKEKPEKTKKDRHSK